VMSAQSLPYLSPEEYLTIEREAEFKSEYYQGKMYPMEGPYAMAGGKRVHSMLKMNFGIELGTALKGRCIVFDSDLRVRVSPTGLYTYPDISVVCDKPLMLDDHDDVLLNPKLIVEVLSKSTEAHDRGLKFVQYRMIESFEEYVLVSQAEPRVERFRRQPGGQWVLSDTVGLDAVVVLESLECQILMAEIYRNVDFALAT
jgi:Uma2 family endonuclease